jgi:hypothetical protein
MRMIRTMGLLMPITTSSWDHHRRVVVVRGVSAAQGSIPVGDIIGAGAVYHPDPHVGDALIMGFVL